MSTNAEKRRAANAKERERRKAAAHGAQPAGRAKSREPDAAGWGMLVALTEMACSVTPSMYLTPTELTEVRAGMRRMCCTSDMDRAKYDRAYRETCAGIACAQVEQERNQSPEEDS